MNNMTVIPTSSGVGSLGQMPLSPPVFPEENMEGFVDLSNLVQINNTTDTRILRTLDDEHAYQFDDIESALTNANVHCDNVIDPDIYLCHNNESHELTQTATSPWAPSPYGELDCQNDADTSNPASPNIQPVITEIEPTIFPIFNKGMPDYERQTSLNIVMEVLGTCPVDEHSQNNIHCDNLDQYPPTPSPSINEEDRYIHHPSPSYVHNTSAYSPPVRNRTMSEYQTPFQGYAQDNTRTRAVSADGACDQLVDVSELMLPLNIPSYMSLNNEENQSESQTNNNDDTATTSCNTTCTESSTVDSTMNATSSTHPPPLVSIPSFLSKSLANAPSLELMENDSLDVHGLLDDFMASTEPEQPVQIEKKTPISVETINADHAYSVYEETLTICEQVTIEADAELEEAKPKKNSKITHNSAKCGVVDLTEEEPSTSACNKPSTSTKLERTPSYTRKRNRNNEACRVSRKKRKLQRDDAEDKVQKLEEDNVLMKRKITELEVEVRDTRARLIAQMTRGKAS